MAKHLILNEKPTKQFLPRVKIYSANTIEDLKDEYGITTNPELPLETAARYYESLSSAKESNREAREMILGAVKSKITEQPNHTDTGHP